MVKKRSFGSAPDSKTFNGKRYGLKDVFTSKKDAQREAERGRSIGAYERVVKVGGKYAVYTKPPSKERFELYSQAKRASDYGHNYISPSEYRKEIQKRKRRKEAKR